jgi:hypothetical protein
MKTMGFASIVFDAIAVPPVTHISIHINIHTIFFIAASPIRRKKPVPPKHIYPMALFKRFYHKKIEGKD